jgi:hypothetical protein
MQVRSIVIDDDGNSTLKSGLLPEDIVDDKRDYAAICAILSDGHPVFLTQERRWIYPETVLTTAGPLSVDSLVLEERISGDGSPGTAIMHSVKFVVKEAAHGLLIGIERSAEGFLKELV